MELHTLNRGKKDNRYCGPAVISFLTGMNTSEAAGIIRMNTGRRSIITTHCGEIRTVLRQCGYNMIHQWSYRNIKTAPTIARWLRENKDKRSQGRVFLILAGRHWQLVTGRRFACGQTGDIVSIKHPKVHRRARVLEVFEITQRLSDPRTSTVLEDLRAYQMKIRNHRDVTITTPRKTCKLLAERHDIELDVEDFGHENYTVYMWPPQWYQDAREDGEVDYIGIAYDWPDCLECLEHIIEGMEEYRK